MALYAKKVLYQCYRQTVIDYKQVVAKLAIFNIQLGYLTFWVDR